MCRFPRSAYGHDVTIRLGVSPDVAAKAWDEYMRRLGPSAYVVARYIHADHLPPRVDRVPERDRPRS